MADIDYTKYPIKQINSTDASNKEDVLRQIIEITADPFRGKLPVEVFLETGMRVAMGSKEPWHQFYVVDPNQEKLTIVTSFRIMYRRGNHNNVNLLIGNVHTNRAYRKQGFVRYMIDECIKKYEIPGYQFAAAGSDDKDTDAYISQHIRHDIYHYYWTLYSGVSELYAIFGFKSVREMNWLIYEEPVTDKKQHPTSDLEPYPDTGAKVTFFKTDPDLADVNKYFFDPAFASYVNADEPPLVRSTSLESASVDMFYIRDALVSAHFGRSHNPCIGLKIFHEAIGKQTFVFICGSIDYSGILLQKLFTDLSANSEEEAQLLIQDLAYIVKAIKHVLVTDYSLLFQDFATSIKLLITTQDICTKDQSTHEFVVRTLQKDWQLDASHKDFLPMMKDWAKPGVTDGVRWINNGFWCFG